MAGPNAQPIRGHRKDQMLVELRATFTAGAWVVDTTNTDTEFWTTTVTDTGTGDNAFNFKLSYGAKRAIVVGFKFLPATLPPTVTDGTYAFISDPVLTTGVMQVRTFGHTSNANPTLVAGDPASNSILNVTLALETL